MSVEQDIPRNMPKNENLDHQEEGDVVIDAVHGRFRKIDNTADNTCRIYIRCDDCSSEIAWNNVAIKNHFNNLHPSKHSCRYCKNKVFIYRKVIIVDDTESSEEIIYHECDHNQQAKTNM